MDIDGFCQPSEYVLNQPTLELDGKSEITPNVPYSIDKTEARKPMRRRALTACKNCHKRKVRCDAMTRGKSCTNCALDLIKCEIPSSYRRKLQRAELSAPLPKSVNSPAPRSPDGMHQRQSDPKHHINTPRDFSILDLEFTENIQNEISQTACLNTPPVTETNVSFTKLSPKSVYKNILYTFFDFIEVESLAHLAPEDLRFLESKGCFHFPSVALLDELVREYFLHVHPMLPIINEKEFWRIYHPCAEKGARGKISLFVFRAMLFVSCSFVSENSICQLGFKNAVEARTCLYRRAKLLFDFNTTSDPIALSQGALIMTHYSSDREPLANSVWLRIAHQYAQATSVSLYNCTPNLSSERKSIYKRLWWCLILRDKILQLGVRRPIQITRDNYDLSQLEFSAKDLVSELDGSLVYDSETKHDLAKIFFAQLELAMELTDPLSYIYHKNGCPSVDTLGSVELQLMQSKIQQWDQALNAWNIKFQTLFNPDTSPNKHKSILLYCGLTSIYYYSSRAALCQYESFTLQEHERTSCESRMKELGGILHSSVVNISRIAREFVLLGVAKYLPVSAVAYLALPIFLNSLDLQIFAPSNAQTIAKQRQLRLLNKAMEICHKRYSGSIAADNMIKRTIAAACQEHDFASCVHISTTTSHCLPLDVKDWLDIFVNRPAQYLRLSFTIDFSFSTGQYPDAENHLPPRLTIQNERYSSPLSRNLGPFWNKPELLEEFITDPTENSPLNWLDSSKVQSSHGAEECWDGQMVDDMLNEMLYDMPS